jgi:hypothetical protein
MIWRSATRIIKTSKKTVPFVIAKQNMDDGEVQCVENELSLTFKIVSNDDIRHKRRKPIKMIGDYERNTEKS